MAVVQKRLTADEYESCGIVITADSTEKNEARIEDFLEALWRFYTNIYRESSEKFVDEKYSNGTIINLPDFYNMVFVEAMHELMPNDFKPQCKGMRALSEFNKNAGLEFAGGWLPGFNSRQHNDCYEKGIPKRNQEFLVTYTRDMPERPGNTFGRDYFGKCEEENDCACKIKVEDTPSPSQVFEWNFEKMKLNFPGMGLQDYVLLTTAHSVGGIHTGA